MDNLGALVDALSSDSSSTTIRVRLGTVTAVVAGGAADGNAAVTVNVNGSTVVAPYLAAYSSPTVGHNVEVLLVNGSPLILGRVIGLPSF